MKWYESYDTLDNEIKTWGLFWVPVYDIRIKELTIIKNKQTENIAILLLQGVVICRRI